MRNYLQNFSVLLLAQSSLCACMFSVLDDDLKRLDQATHLFAGKTVTPDGESVEIVVVAMHDAAGKEIAGFRIKSLDGSRYQAWAVSYPSGMRLPWVARGIYQVMQVLHVQYPFDDLHIVAHSMGGLVSKGTLNICAANRSCDYIRSYTTISTPWAGVASAENGTQWSPTVVPVWWDLVPSSEYLTALFDTPFPDDLVYHLLFGYRSSGGFSGENSDGVILLKRGTT